MSFRSRSQSDVATITELGMPPRDPVLISGDNNGSISMAKNPEFHKWTKHMDIR
jgi:hypothetical protein